LCVDLPEFETPGCYVAVDQAQGGGEAVSEEPE